MDEFIAWLNAELAERGMSNNELARRANMSSANMSKALTGKIAITWEFCAGVSGALGYTPEFVFRRAGLLPPVASPENVQAITDIARHLTPDNLRTLRAIAQCLYQQQK